MINMTYLRTVKDMIEYDVHPHSGFFDFIVHLWEDLLTEGVGGGNTVVSVEQQ